MKLLLWLAAIVCLPAGLMAQGVPAPTESGSQRFLFPADSLWGYTQFDVAPPHNEVDPNLCSANSAKYGGANAPCNAFGRYLLSANIELHPFGRTFLRRMILFTEPKFLFGKNVPQALYTWSMSPIGWERMFGAGIDMPRGFQVRVTQHYVYSRLGSRAQYLGAADLGTNGPWGRYNAVGVRKYFGRQRNDFY